MGLLSWRFRQSKGMNFRALCRAATNAMKIAF